MLAHRLRRWPNIGQTLCRCVVFSGMHGSHHSTTKSWAMIESSLFRCVPRLFRVLRKGSGMKSPTNCITNWAYLVSGEVFQICVKLWGLESFILSPTSLGGASTEWRDVWASGGHDWSYVGLVLAIVADDGPTRDQLRIRISFSLSWIILATE